MRSFLIAAALMTSIAGFSTQADELDREKAVTTEQIQLAKALPKTVVIRVNQGTNRAEVLHSNRALPASDASKRLVSTSSFIRLDADGHAAGELDRDSSSSSWYFYCPPGWNYPTYYYYGYNYNYSPYYSYYWGGYQYSYYSWRY